MARYFFDIVDGGPQRDDTGTECANTAEMRRVARRTIPEIARDEIARDGERHAITIVVRDEKGVPVYTATLSYIGMDLTKRPA